MAQATDEDLRHTSGVPVRVSPNSSPRATMFPPMPAHTHVKGFLLVKDMYTMQYLATYKHIMLYVTSCSRDVASALPAYSPRLLSRCVDIVIRAVLHRRAYHAMSLRRRHSSSSQCLVLHRPRHRSCLGTLHADTSS